MPEAVTEGLEAHIFARTYSPRENANKAIEAFQDLVVQLDEKQARDAYIHLLVGRGFPPSEL